MSVGQPFAVMLRDRFVSLLAVVLLLGSGQPLAAQPADEPAAQPPATQAERSDALPTVEEVAKAREAAAANTELDEATRAALDQHFEKAIEHLTAANTASKLTAQLEAELQNAPQHLEEAEKRLTEPVSLPVAPEAVTDMESVEKLQQHLTETEQALNNARQRQKEAADELDRRQKRRPQLPDLQTQNKKDLADVATQLAAPDPEGEPPAVRAARLIRFRAREHRLKEEAKQFEQELRTYEGTSRNWALQRDLAEREAGELDELVQTITARIAALKQKQAEADARAAQRAAMEADPALRREADLNADLANRNLELLASAEETQKQLTKRTESLQNRETQFSDLKRRAEASEFSSAVGVLLRNQQAALPDPKVLLANSRQRQETITRLNIDIIDWESERRLLFTDLEGQVNQLVQTVRQQFPDAMDDELRGQVRELLSSRLKHYQDLIANGNMYLDKLVRLDTEEKLLAEQIEEEEQWLAEHVLWVRSAEWVGSSANDFSAALRLVLRAEDWRVAGQLLWDYTQQNWLWFGALLASLTLVLSVRRRIKQRIRKFGEQAQKTTSIEFLPTIAAQILTLVIAWPVPLIVWLIGRRFESGLGENAIVLSLAEALQSGGLLWGLVESVRLTAQVDGVGEAHFGWGKKVTRSVRRFTNLFALSFLPLALVTEFLETFQDDLISSSIGRVSFMALMASLAWALYRLLNADSPIRQSLSTADPASVLRRTSWLWPRVVFLSPLVLVVLSGIGYHYAAQQLTQRIAETIVSVLILLLGSELVSRWLLISYRRLAIQRARELRLKRQQESVDVPSGEAIPVEDSRLDLGEVNMQARRIIRITLSGLTLVALYLIWVDVMPALGVLNTIEVWPNALAATDADAPAVWITAADILVAIIIAAITLMASRNLPGLMEVAFLKRLPLDAGARYAATTVSRYLIVVTGFLLGFRQIGVGWSSVQWLVAAMSVGLGFGLQEIFANFVSGIILLFERPIRVGDVVSIGDFTGCVTRIRIRATTIMDWDNKDVIVPNREMVTGNLVNWTLTNPSLRVILVVGVAYGSDTKLTTKLLYQAAEEHDAVLKDPAPMVIFSSFGDNALTFELRVHIKALAFVLSGQHELRMRIDELFRENKIEIAFPQRDLHVRSLPKELLESLSGRKPETPADESDRDAA